MKHLLNIFRLGIKELRSLWHDKIMIVLIIYSFSIAIYVGATAAKSEIHNAPIAFLDEDRSILSRKIIDAFYPPRFKSFKLASFDQGDEGLDAGKYTFVVTIPPNFEKEVISGKHPEIQLNIDATRMTQAGIGAGYIQQIINREVAQALHQSTIPPVGIITRMKYNPNLEGSWFGGVMEIISMISLLSIVLTGAALIREREHGTLEHLMVMPLSAFEIMLGKVWSMGLVVLIAAALSLRFVVEGVLHIPIAGSEILFLCGAFLVLFATTSMGIFMGTIARTMPQFGLILILTILPLQILSGGITPYESMPDILQYIMKLAPTSHFVSMAQAVLYRGAGIEIVWPDFIAMFVIGLVYFSLALMLFRRSLSASS